MIRDQKQCCALHGFIADRRRTQRGGKEKTKADQPPLRSLAATGPSIYPPHRRACVSNNSCQNMYKVGSNKSLSFSSPSISTTCFIISWKRPTASHISHHSTARLCQFINQAHVFLYFNILLLRYKGGARPSQRILLGELSPLPKHPQYPLLLVPSSAAGSSYLIA